MKNKKALLGVFASVWLGLGSLPAWAQSDHGGNGGGVHVCYDGQKLDAQGERVIKSIEMYDLYEGRERYFFDSPLPAGLATEQDFLRYAYRSTQAHGGYHLFDTDNGRAALAARLEAAVALVEKKIQPTDQVLYLVPDAHHLLHGENCVYDQLANWDDRTGRLLVKSKYYEMIKKIPLSLAAFKTHEGFYYLDRKYNGAVNSDNARESNAMVYEVDRGRGALKVEVASAVKKNGVTVLRPQWTKASCYPYSVNFGDVVWELSFEKSDDKPLPQLKGWMREEYSSYFSGDSAETWNLNKFKTSTWGTAYTRFELSPLGGLKMNAKVKVRSRTCGEYYETLVENRNGKITFSIDP